MATKQEGVALQEETVARRTARLARERWLVFSYWANVEGMAPSYHIDDRWPHLLAEGVELEMITSVCGPRPEGWEGRWHQVPSPSPSGLRFELRYLARRWPGAGGRALKLLLTTLLLPLYWLEKLLVRVSSTFWWWITAGPTALWWSARRPPDLVYSTGGPPSAHLAAALVARMRGVPWIAEVQDPLVYHGLGPGWLAQRWACAIERLLHRRATGVVYLTRTASERARARLGGPAALTAIYPGAEVVAWPDPAPAQRERLRMLHAGTLGGSRNPETLLAALQQLARGERELRKELLVVLLGASDRATERALRAFPYQLMLSPREKLPRRAALAEIAAADVLLVMQNRDPVSEETIPSKTYEYLASGRPILGLLYHNAELAELLQTAGHSAVEIEQVEEIAQEVAGFHRRWHEGKLFAARCVVYTCARAAAELVAWARQLREGREGDAGREEGDAHG